MLYNVKCSGACEMYSADQLRESAAACGREYISQGGNRCKLAYLHNGWATMVTVLSGTVVQGWAGEFTLA